MLTEYYSLSVKLELRVGFEPTYKCFADTSITRLWIIAAYYSIQGSYPRETSSRHLSPVNCHPSGVKLRWYCRIGSPTETWTRISRVKTVYTKPLYYEAIKWSGRQDSNLQNLSAPNGARYHYATSRLMFLPAYVSLWLWQFGQTHLKFSLLWSLFIPLMWSNWSVIGLPFQTVPNPHSIHRSNGITLCFLIREIIKFLDVVEFRMKCFDINRSISSCV